MTQIFKNFQSDALGNIPADMVLRRNAVNSDYQIAESGPLKFLKYFSTSASSAKGVSYTGAPSSGATEIYADIEDIDGSAPASARLVAYATDSPDNEYGAYNQAGTLTLYRRVGGSFTNIGTLSTGFGQTVPQRLLLKVTPGTPNIIQARAWRAADPEPGVWSIETTDGSLTLTTGWSGHVGFAQSDEVRYKAIGIGTNNDPAPRNALTPSNQIIFASAINSAEQFGQLALSPGAASILATAIDSAEQFGLSDFIAGPVPILASGIPSESVVSPMAFYAGGSAIFADAIASDEQFGDLSFIPGPVAISAAGIDSESVVSSPELIAGPAVIYAESIPSAELFGDLNLFNVQQLIRLVGIDTAEAFGSTTVEGGADLSGWLTGRINIKPALTASVGVNRVH